MHIRPATSSDVPAIARLFNALIPETTITWRDEPASISEMEIWFAERLEAGHPVLVAEVADPESSDPGARTIVSYTNWTGFRGGSRFPGYRHTVEISIHVDGRFHGRGIGRSLLTELMEVGRQRDVHVMVACIDADNTESIAFHQALGFEVVGRMPELGRKFDRWLDLVLMQRILT